MVKIVKLPNPEYNLWKVFMEHVPDDTVPAGCRHVLHAVAPGNSGYFMGAVFWPFPGSIIDNVVLMYSQLPYTLMFACQYCYGHTSGIQYPVFDIRQVTPDFRVVPVTIGDRWL